MNFTEVDKGTNMDVQVRAQDQDQINECSRNNHRLMEIEEDMKMKAKEEGEPKGISVFRAMQALAGMQKNKGMKQGSNPIEFMQNLS